MDNSTPEGVIQLKFVVKDTGIVSPLKISPGSLKPLPRWTPPLPKMQGTVWAKP